jgi:hypothetical protein
VTTLLAELQTLLEGMTLLLSIEKVDVVGEMLSLSLSWEFALNVNMVFVVVWQQGSVAYRRQRKGVWQLDRDDRPAPSSNLRSFVVALLDG